MIEKTYFVYILFNKYKGVLYTGVTSNLFKRVYEHKNNFVKGFTQKYNVHKLGYYELYNDINLAIERKNEENSIELLKTVL